jgi:hypothetical protein
MTVPAQPSPTGLDYHEAYKAMFPGLVAQGIRLQDVQDSILKTVDRAARLRRAERERVKDAFHVLAARVDNDGESPLAPGVVAELIRETAEEIR